MKLLLVALTAFSILVASPRPQVPPQYMGIPNEVAEYLWANRDKTSDKVYSRTIITCFPRVQSCTPENVQGWLAFVSFWRTANSRDTMEVNEDYLGVAVFHLKEVVPEAKLGKLMLFRYSDGRTYYEEGGE